MGNMALIIFSLCLQAAIGIVIFAGLTKLLAKDSVLKPAVLTAAALAIVGLLASLMHLGRPLSALGSLTQFGSSWLSREIWFSGIFTILILIAALLIYFKPLAKSAANTMILLAAIVGVANIWAMAAIYSSSSVPAWQHSFIYIEFYAAAISMGAAIFLALSLKEALRIKKVTVLFVGVVVTFQVVAMILYYIQVGASASLAARQSLALLSGMGGLLTGKWLFILLGVGLLFFLDQRANLNVTAGQAAMEAAVTKEGALSANLYAVAAALLIIGHIIGRYLFYATAIASSVGLS